MTTKLEATVTVHAGQTKAGHIYLEVESKDLRAIYAAVERTLSVIRREPTYSERVETNPEDSPVKYVRWYFESAEGRDRAGAALLATLAPDRALPFQAPPPVA